MKGFVVGGFQIVVFGLRSFFYFLKSAILRQTDGLPQFLQILFVQYSL